MNHRGAAFRLPRRDLSRRLFVSRAAIKSVETSLDAADTSVRATQASRLLA